LLFHNILKPILRKVFSQVFFFKRIPGKPTTLMSRLCKKGSNLFLFVNAENVLFMSLKCSYCVLNKWKVLYTYTRFFIRTPKFWLKLDVLIFSTIFRLKCSYWRS